MHNALMAPRETDREKRDRASRLRTARGLRFAGPAEAARAFKWSYPTYAAHENETRGYAHLVKKYGKAFGVRWQWLLMGEEPMMPDIRDDWDELISKIPDRVKPKAMLVLRQFLPDDE